MVLLLLIPDKRRERICISISHGCGMKRSGRGGKGRLCIRAGALSVEIAVTEDDMIWNWGIEDVG